MNFIRSNSKYCIIKPFDPISDLHGTKIIQDQRAWSVRGVVIDAPTEVTCEPQRIGTRQNPAGILGAPHVPARFPERGEEVMFAWTYHIDPLFVNGEEIVVVPIEDVFCVIGEDGMEPLNGYLFVDTDVRVVHQGKTTFSVDNWDEGIVAFAGKPNIRYRNPRRVDNPQIKPGCRVLFKKKAGMKVEYGPLVGGRSIYAVPNYKVSLYEV